MLGGAGILVHGITFNIATLLFSHTKFPIYTFSRIIFCLGPPPPRPLLSSHVCRVAGAVKRCLSKRFLSKLFCCC